MNNTFDAWEGEHLEHYGVLGMKWGQRRFQNSDGSLTAAGVKRYAETGEYGYKYRSHATKKYMKKQAKAARNGNIEKAKKYANRAKRSAEIDKEEQRYANQVKSGGNIAARLLTNGIGSKGYQMHVAMNRLRNNSPGSGGKVGAYLLNRFAGGRLVGGNIRKAMYIRQDERTAKTRTGKFEANKDALMADAKRRAEELRKKAQEKAAKYRK